MLSYLHKVKDGRQVYFVANSADQRVDMDLTVRGHVSLQRWDPLDGSVAAAETSDRMVGGQPCEPSISPWSEVNTTIVVPAMPASSSVLSRSPRHLSNAVQCA